MPNPPPNIVVPSVDYDLYGVALPTTAGVERRVGLTITTLTAGNYRLIVDNRFRTISVSGQTSGPSTRGQALFDFAVGASRVANIDVAFTPTTPITSGPGIRVFLVNAGVTDTGMALASTTVIFTDESLVNEAFIVEYGNTHGVGEYHVDTLVGSVDISYGAYLASSFDQAKTRMYFSPASPTGIGFGADKAKTLEVDGDTPEDLYRTADIRWDDTYPGGSILILDAMAGTVPVRRDWMRIDNSDAREIALLSGRDHTVAGSDVDLVLFYAYGPDGQGRP